jgi:hypothetical protein
VFGRPPGNDFIRSAGPRRARAPVIVLGLAYSAATTWRDGGGIGRPNAVASSNQAATASRTAARAASAVSPSDMQPGKSGTNATNPPPSSSGRGSIITGYSSFCIACFQDCSHELDQLTDVNRLDRPALRGGQNITLCRIGHLPMRAASARCATPDTVLSTECRNIVNRPVAGRTGLHPIKTGSGHRGPCIPVKPQPAHAAGAWRNACSGRRRPGTGGNARAARGGQATPWRH